MFEGRKYEIGRKRAQPAYHAGYPEKKGVPPDCLRRVHSSDA